MGYGVKPKAESKWNKLKAAVQVAAAFNAPKKNMSGFIDVQIGANDLKARLAAKRAAVAEEMKAFESMDLSIPDFIKTFRTNANLIKKVSQTTGIEEAELKKFEDSDLEVWFVEMDTDNSGTLDFREFVEGLVKLSEDKKGAKPAVGKTRLPKRRQTVC